MKICTNKVQHTILLLLKCLLQCIRIFLVLKWLFSAGSVAKCGIFIIEKMEKMAKMAKMKVIEELAHYWSDKTCEFFYSKEENSNPC